MGQIVEFKGLRRDSVPHSQAVIEGSAQILFFTGVRYARENGVQPAASPTRKGRSRGWLNARRGKRTKPS